MLCLEEFQSCLHNTYQCVKVTRNIEAWKLGLMADQGEGPKGVRTCDEENMNIKNKWRNISLLRSPKQD